MNKNLFTPLLAFAILVSACSTTPSTEEAVQESSTLVADLVNQSLTQSAPIAAEEVVVSHPTFLTADFENAASVEMQLILGTIKLEGTAQTITKEQANTLLPLWESYLTLSQSRMPSIDGAGQGQPPSTQQPPTVNEEAQMQLSELIKQIQSAMTVEQIQTITGLNMTQESVQTIMQELGLDMTGPQQGADGGGRSGVEGQGLPPSGGQDGQVRPGGNFADNGQPGGASVPSTMIEELIHYLQLIAN